LDEDLEQELERNLEQEFGRQELERKWICYFGLEVWRFGGLEVWSQDRSQEESVCDLGGVGVMPERNHENVCHWVGGEPVKSIAGIG
jgi:hypothetical protein